MKQLQPQKMFVHVCLGEGSAKPLSMLTATTLSTQVPLPVAAATA